MSWAEGRLRGADTETTGTDVSTDRIITTAIVTVVPDHRPNLVQWLIDPGCEVPAEAAAVHGWTRARIVETIGAEGKALRVGDGQRLQIPIDGALFEIAGLLARAMQTEVPVVAANAAFDLTLLETELDRYGIDTLTSRPFGIRGVVDPMCIEKQWDPFRKICYKAPGCRREEGYHECGGCRGGKHPCRGCGATDKTLSSLCRHYGVPLTSAHDAAADALAAVRLATRLAGLWPQVGRWKLPTLHEHQVTWKREQSDSLREYFDKQGTVHDGVDGGWPLFDSARAIHAQGMAS